MRHALRLCLAAILTLALTGCDSSDPYEAAAEKTVANIKEMASVMNGVKTAADAEAAAPKLEAVAKEFEGISADLKKLPKMTEDQKTKVKKVLDDSKGEMEKVSIGENMPTDPAVGQKLGEAAMKATMAMTEVAVQFELQGMSRQ
jgi:hypothetical protein